MSLIDYFSYQELFNQFCLEIGWDNSDEIMKQYFITSFLENRDYTKTVSEISSWLAQYYYICYSNDEIPNNYIDNLFDYSLLGITEKIR